MMLSFRDYNFDSIGRKTLLLAGAAVLVLSAVQVASAQPQELLVDEAASPAPADAELQSADQPVEEAADAPGADSSAELPASEGANTAEAAQGAASEQDAEISIPEVPPLANVPAPDENIFFDAEALVPQGEMARKGGPRKVNPAVEPASKFIVVTRDHGAGSRQAQFVAADRAMKLGRFESALSIYDAMYQKNRRDPNVLLGRAVALQHMGHTESAIQAYEELLDIRPDNVEAQTNMYGLIGARYPAVAIQKLSALLDKQPDNVGLIAQMAVMSARIGRYDDALRYLGMAAAMEPENPSHIFNIAVVADQSGNRKEAVSYYEKALEMDTMQGGGSSVPRESIYERLAQLR